MNCDDNNYPKRKANRLSEYDYSSPGAYFITICTWKKRCILGKIAVGAGIARPPIVELSEYGRAVQSAICSIESHYENITVNNYVIMPNHVHLILQIHTNEDGRAMPAPTVSTVIQQMKGTVCKQTGQKIWQKLFYDHVIRNEDDYWEIYNYIDSNPVKWIEDKLYNVGM